MASPLAGIRILELANFQMGPAATVMLADLGADVIKIEDPFGGDLARGIVKLLGQTIGVASDRNFYFESINRNKRSITIDLKKEKGRQVLHRLVGSADAFVTNVRLGVAERIGADYETLAKLNPRLVYGHASGYGPKGPDASKPAFDPLGLARSGMMDALTPAGLPPQWPTGAIADQYGATMLSYAVLAGLVSANLTGRGQKVSSSLLGSTMFLGQFCANATLMVQHEQRKFQREEVSNPLQNCYRCADGRWIFFAMSQPDRHWPSFCAALGIRSLQHDERYATAETRAEHSAELIAILDGIFATKSVDEWVATLDKYGVLGFDVVASMSNLVYDPQVIANRYVVDFDHPVLGTIKMMGFPISFEEMPAQVRMPAPELGQHTEEILIELCDYSWNEIAELRDEAVI
ncbi:MAG: CoA transferase [Chloroflexota bacterium]|nr:MAG: CoA transferase [Chloroflexota bacterium]